MRANTVVIGRDQELQLLETCRRSDKAELVALYGRRRVGKSFLLKSWSKPFTPLFLEGIENQDTQSQIENFTNMLSSQTGNNLYQDAKFHKWTQVFDLLTQIIKEKNQQSSKRKFIIILDEFQWMCAKRTSLVSLFKRYWDQEWQYCNVMIVLCGSIASFMVNKVIKAKALYGRISLEYCLPPLTLKHSSQLVRPARGEHENLLYYFVFGGIPKYYNDINPSRSFIQNLNDLCFTKKGPLYNEFEKVFYQQFTTARNYQRIVMLLSHRPLTFSEISKKMKFSSGGGLKTYLENLIHASFIDIYTPFHRGSKSKEKRYVLTDAYCRFYFEFIQPLENSISDNLNRDLFTKISKDRFHSWKGHCFENLCYSHKFEIAKICGFEDQVKHVGKFFPNKISNTQIDLVFERFDGIFTIYEIKHNEQKIGLEIIIEMQKKLEKLKKDPTFKRKTIEVGLICSGEIDERVYAQKFFHHIVTAKDLM